MDQLNLSAPWYTFQKKFKALFELDPDIIVGEIFESNGEKTNYAFNVEVKNHKKFLALERFIPNVKQFGKVSLGIILFDEENTNREEISPKAVNVLLFKIIFEGNRIVKDIRDVVDMAGAHHGFVRFQPEVIQFFNDDLRDYNGNWSGLAQDIAYEVFENHAGVNFCTADIRENEA